MTEIPELDIYREWIGRSERACMRIESETLRRFRATFNLPQQPDEPGLPAPPGIHWCLHAEASPTEMLAPDGHPPRGGFLPPIGLPQRMWAGGRVDFMRPLRQGDTLFRTSRIEEISRKAGRTGQLYFVTVSHTLQADDEVVIKERQDIVYRDTATAAISEFPTQSSLSQEAPLSQEWPWIRPVDPQSTLLFRYSALTFNGHRIHYDRRYCLEVEGYPGLVVHGPLQATLLLQFATEINGGEPPRAFEFRSTAPLFDDTRFWLVASRSEGKLKMCTLDWSGKPAMRATAS